jgi:hypothetical protein
MFVLLPHASPAEIVMASGAVHMWTSTILLNSYSALRAFPYIIPAEIGPKINYLFTPANIITMPRFLAFKTATSLTLNANNFSLIA